MSNFSDKEIYKLFIDKKRLKMKHRSSDEKRAEPHLLFDVKEPGYYESMRNAFDGLGRNMGNRVDLSYLVELHDRAINRVLSMRTGIMPGNFYYHIINDKWSDEAAKELFRSKVLFIPHQFFKLLSPNRLSGKATDPQDVLNSTAMNNLLKKPKTQFLSEIKEEFKNFKQIKSIYSNEEYLSKKLTPLIDHYYKSIERTTTLNSRLSAIAELIRALEVSHFFPDGNQRTYAFLLLPKLLMENGIPLVILDDPAMFDGYRTIDELVKELKHGNANFLNNDESRQRDFLTKKCKVEKSQIDEWVLGKNNYRPYYKNNRAKTLATKTRNKLIKKARRIKKDQMDQELSSPEMTPLALAILLDSDVLIGSLLKKGASPFANGVNKRIAYNDNTPLGLASLLGDLKLMDVLTKGLKPHHLPQPPDKTTTLTIGRLIQDVADIAETKDDQNFDILKRFLPYFVKGLKTLKGDAHDRRTRRRLREIRESLKEWSSLDERYAALVTTTIEKIDRVVKAQR